MRAALLRLPGRPAGGGRMSPARRARTGAPEQERRSRDEDVARDRGEMPERRREHPVKRVALGILGGVLLVVGVALLVLPGPGLLLVLAGLILLSRAVPAVQRVVEPVRTQAMQAAEASVASRWRIAGTVLGGAALVAAGVVWGLAPWSWLPFTGWSTGSSLIFSGAVVFALLAWSYRRVHGPRPER